MILSKNPALHTHEQPQVLSIMKANQAKQNYYYLLVNGCFHGDLH